MNEPLHPIAKIEWANYAATQAIARVTPGLDISLTPEVVITSSEILRSPDTNHACLLRTTVKNADALIDQIVDHFKARNLTPTIMLSAVCTPADLPDRLIAHGFIEQEEQEAWMMLAHLDELQIPAPSAKVHVRPITDREALTFSRVFMAAFGMPTDFAPYMAQLLQPAIGRPGIRHYVALANEQPIGVCSLLCYETYGILGSAGVLQAHRGSKAATNLAITAARDAQGQGINTLILQTKANAPLERLLRISGFERILVRTSYSLP